MKPTLLNYHVPRIVAVLAGLLCMCMLVSAAPLNPCFTPGQDCTAVIVEAVDAAKQELLVQAYGFTSCPIIEAIARAKDRGLQVKVLLDRSNEQRRYAGVIVYLRHHGIEPLVDHKPRIAHNKVIIVDRRRVITGSFNFTKSAQTSNAENVVFISNKKLARTYMQNWRAREAVSRAVATVISPETSAACSP